ncbi:MAG: hypothetical protein ACOCUW_01405 [Gemmatimonadota bacterium]
MVGFFTFIMTLVLGILALMAGIQWLSGRRPGSLEDDGDRFGRLESAVTSLESRLEALEDQQRFLERLLAERPERSLGPGGASREREGPDGSDSILFDTGKGDGGGG